jgi:hypothetical protein
MERRRRRRWIWLVALGVLLLGGWFAVRMLLQPERLSAFLLQQAGDATGLVITLDQPADVGFWPDLHLELQGLEVRAPGSDRTILRGERAEIVLPWSALRGGDLRLRELRLVPMTLDLDALSEWLDTRADAGPPAPWRLPRLDTGLLVSDGRITWGDRVISDFSLDLDGLHDGERSSASLGGVLGTPDRDLRFGLDLVFVPRQHGDEIRLDPLAIVARDAPDADPWLDAEGSAAFDIPRHLRFDLQARLPQWHARWPTLPLPESPTAPLVLFAVEYTGTPQLQGTLALRVLRGDESLEASLELGDVLAWIGEPDAPLLPPMTGSMKAQRLQLDGVEASGVELRISDDAVPEVPEADANDARP